jgi:hypothetical protein
MFETEKNVARVGLVSKGAGSAMLRHIIMAARQMGLSRLSLETGSWPYFAPARELYSRHGLVECPPFGRYIADPNSVCMTLNLVEQRDTQKDAAFGRTKPLSSTT